MEKRYILFGFLAACNFMLLSTCIATHSSWLHSTRVNAPVVSVEPRIDVSQRVGISPIDLPHNRVTIQEEDLTNLNIKWSERTMNLMHLLAYEEGFRSTPYLCSLGYVTVGIGTKLYDVPGADPRKFPISVTRVQAEIWLNEEVDLKFRRIMAREDLGRIYEKLNDDRKTIILSMAYQMGVSRLAKFKNMWKALDAGDWKEAEKQALDSVWARIQTPKRAARHARVLGGEHLGKVYEGI